MTNNSDFDRRNRQFAELANSLGDGKQLRFFGVKRAVNKSGDAVFRAIFADSHDDEDIYVVDLLPEVAKLFMEQFVKVAISSEKHR